MSRIKFFMVSLISFVVFLTTPVYGSYLFGEGDLGRFTGELGYYIINQDTAQIIVNIVNQSKEEGYLTAIAFLLPEDIVLTGFSSQPETFEALAYPINVQPFDKDYGLGASTFKSWEGGGNPSNGIAKGDDGTFTFTITGDNLYKLNDRSFINNNSFVVRFRGFENGGSDKVQINNGPSGQVPEPITLVLLGSGLLFFGIKRRKKHDT